MQDRFQLSVNGQELQQADVNLIGKEASLADDRVFAELLRLAPYNGTTYAKAILPYGYAGLSGNAPTVGPGTGGVVLNPFRAVVGSRTAAGTLATDNWNDIRSQFYTGSSTALQGTQSLTANASGNPRWDLVYVAVSSDANGASNTRYQKNPSTKVVSASSITTTLTTSLAIGVVTGTPAATPAFPALPSDTGVTIYIPLALVRVISGFTGATVLNNKDVYEVAPTAWLSKTTGAATLRPADQSYLQTGTAITGTGTSPIGAHGALAWNGSTNTRPPCFLPPSMSGGESILIAIDLTAASSANWSHQSGAIVDASRDWRNRLFKWTAAVIGTTSSGFPWTNPGSSTAPFNSGAGQLQIGYATSTGNPALVVGVGQQFGTSFTSPAVTLAASGAGSTATPAAGYNVPTFAMATGTTIIINVDSTTGNLKLLVSGTPLCSVVLWLEATGQFTNA